MEDMTVVFFYMMNQNGDGPEEKTGRKRLFGRRKHKETEVVENYKLHSALWRLGDGSLRVICAELPPVSEPGKGRTTCCCRQQCVADIPVPPEGRYVYYVPDKKAGKLLGRGREPINLEWILFFIEYYSLSFDGLVLVPDREMEAEELIRHYAASIAYLGVVTDSAEAWEEVEEDLNLEYGLTLDLQRSAAQLHIKGKRPLIVLGADREETELPEGSIIIATCGRSPEGAAKFFFEKNIRYVDMEGFLRDTVLDTVRKIRYNSTR